MPAAARLLDPTSHPGAISGPCSIDVLINNRPAARQGDPHACALPPPAGPHPPSTISKGSTTVFINGRPAARQSDLAGCGALIAAGSPDVLIGG
ncbi:MAG: PAAR domain-containing protein [Burkholderiaceae bacterium]